MTNRHVHLPPTSTFSKEVYKRVRPHVPRANWPPETVRAAFTAATDGAALRAEFDDFPDDYARIAARAVREAGGELVMMSPLAPAVAAVVQARWWRDTCLLAFVPLMFAIPLMAALGDLAMRLSVVVFTIDSLVLAFSWVVLGMRRSALAGERFAADIPAPGLRLRVVSDTPAAAETGQHAPSPGL